MKVLLFAFLIVARYINIQPKDTLIIKDNVTKGTMYKFIYNTFSSNNAIITLTDPLNRTIGTYKQNTGVVYINQKHDGLMTIKISNPHRDVMKFGYRCPDVNKELQGPLGPIKDEDVVSELLTVLENNIKSQKRQLEKYEGHSKLVQKSRKWVFRFVLFEIISSIGIMYYLHRNTLKMFEKNQTSK